MDSINASNSPEKLPDIHPDFAKLQSASKPAALWFNSLMIILFIGCPLVLACGPLVAVPIVLIIFVLIAGMKSGSDENDKFYRRYTDIYRNTEPLTCRVSVVDDSGRYRRYAAIVEMPWSQEYRCSIIAHSQRDILGVQGKVPVYRDPDSGAPVVADFGTHRIWME